MKRALGIFFKELIWIPLFFLAIYIAIPTRMYYSDGLDFAYFLERSDFGLEGFHPHHQLYLPLMRFLYGICNVAFPELRAIQFLAIISALSGALGIWLFMRILKDRDESNINAALAGFFLGSCFTYWKYSTDADAYMPSLAITLWGLNIVFSSKKELSIVRAIYSGILFALAILIHQISAFIAISVFYYLLLNPVKSPGNFMRFTAFVISLSSVLLIFQIINYLEFMEIFGWDFDRYLAYVTSYTRDRYFWTILNEPIVRVVYESTRSHAHLFFHLKPPEVISYDNIRGDTLQSLLFFRLFAAFSALVVLFTLLMIQRMEKGRLHFFRTIYIWLALVFVFSTVFMPVNHFYKIFYLPPLIVIFSEFLRIIQRKIKFSLKPVISALIAIYFAFGLTQWIIPDSKKDANPFYYDTERLNRFVSQNDLVILPSDNRYRAKFYRYFGKGEALRVTLRIAYLDYWTEIWPRRYEFSQKTSGLFKSRFENIYIAERAWSRGEEFLIFSQYNMPGSKPIVLMLEKERLIVERRIQGFDDQYYKIRIE